MRSRDEVYAQITALAGKIAAPAGLLPRFGSPSYDGQPSVVIDQHGYHWIVRERGQEMQHRTTRDLDTFFYWIFAAVTWQLGYAAALDQRRPQRDDRRVLFAVQVHLLNSLDSRWGQRRQAELAELLREHPYDDAAEVRARLTKAYREQGYAPDVAWTLACEQYPLPTP
jgi:hypothetical protein